MEWIIIIAIFIVSLFLMRLGYELNRLADRVGDLETRVQELEDVGLSELERLPGSPPGTG